ncbi:hypothetical protein FG385_28800 [Amycolatopsis alkalitolerans]|uniref:Uncharacterized protein n=1 Tax=Amycolatopsis alkalitolerans TaxID=2547244 RepID=A0A5C4LUJ7_9PSEU|nr:hypothetical protein FG385_28800 [Amycolatopsis alkalitolerans]
MILMSTCSQGLGFASLPTITTLRTCQRLLTAYNLQIDGIHTYYAGTTPILVHNSCGYTPAGGFADSDIDEIAQAVYQHVGAVDVPGRPGLAQVRTSWQGALPSRLNRETGVLRR